MALGPSNPYEVSVEGLARIRADLETADTKLRSVAAKALNTTARRYRTVASREIRTQVAFPARYLDSRSDGNLFIARQAAPENLETVIRGRQRPTSLARFVKGPRVGGRRSPRVEVSPGNVRKMDRAFLMNLRSGNVGLAVRLAPGEKVTNKREMVRVQGNLYLLYGPSVDQVFRSVAPELAPEAAEFLENEFARLVEVFT